MTGNNISDSGANGTGPSWSGVVPGRSRCKAAQVVSKRNAPCMRIGHWNVRTMNKDSKLENLKIEMTKLKLDALGICEVRWKGCGDFISEDFRVIYSGGDRRERGVEVILGKTTRNCVEKVVTISDRILSIRLKGEKVDTVLIQVYMPTSDYSNEEVDEEYQKIEEALKEAEKDGKCNVIVMGDWNGVVGDRQHGKQVGKFGMGTRNERGEKLVQFCEQHKFVITNTWYQQHKRRLYTWSKPGNTGKFQIDFILVKERFRNAVKSVKTYPGADVDSDHNLLVMENRITLRRVKYKQRKKKWNLESLKQKEIRSALNREIKTNNVKKRETAQIESEIEDTWKRLKESMIKAATKEIGLKKGSKETLDHTGHGRYDGREKEMEK